MKEDQETNAHKDVRFVSKQSERILAKCRESFEKRQVSPEELQRIQREFSKTKAKNTAFTPSITKMARKLERAEPAHERLYEEGLKKSRESQKNLLGRMAPSAKEDETSLSPCYFGVRGRVFKCPQVEPIDAYNNIYRSVSVNNYLREEIKPARRMKEKREKVGEMVSRSQQWIQRKNERLNRMREAKVDPDLSECTFKPKTNRFKGDVSRSTLGNECQGTTRKTVMINGVEFELRNS